jgi:hypothetical protein
MMLFLEGAHQTSKRVRRRPARRKYTADQRSRWPGAAGRQRQCAGASTSPCSICSLIGARGADTSGEW